MPLIWLDYKVFSVFFSFFSHSETYNVTMALTVSHGKKLDAERPSCHKDKNEQKSDNLQFLRRHCSSVLTICTVLEHSYPTISISKPNVIIPSCSFLSWSYFAPFVNLSQLIIERASQVGLLVKNPPGNAGDVREAGSIPRSKPRFSPWRKKWSPIPVFLPGKVHR